MVSRVATHGHTYYFMSGPKGSIYICLKPKVTSPGSKNNYLPSSLIALQVWGSVKNNTLAFKIDISCDFDK